MAGDGARTRDLRRDRPSRSSAKTTGVPTEERRNAVEALTEVGTAKVLSFAPGRHRAVESPARRFRDHSRCPRDPVAAKAKCVPSSLPVKPPRGAQGCWSGG